MEIPILLMILEVNYVQNLIIICSQGYTLKRSQII